MDFISANPWLEAEVFMCPFTLSTGTLKSVQLVELSHFSGNTLCEHRCRFSHGQFCELCRATRSHCADPLWWIWELWHYPPDPPLCGNLVNFFYFTLHTAQCLLWGETWEGNLRSRLWKDVSLELFRLQTLDSCERLSRGRSSRSTARTAVAPCCKLSWIPWMRTVRDLES